MTLKRIYNLKNQRITHRHENLSKMCVCISLVLLVLCGIIGLAVYFVKNAQSNSDEKYGQTNYHDVGNNNVQQVNKNYIRHKGVRKNYESNSVAGKAVATSNTAEFISTTIESPLSTSTMSPKDVPARFLTVTTINTIDISTSDYSAVSSNDYVQIITEMEVDKSSTESVLMNDPATTLDGYSTKRTEVPTDTNNSITPKTVKAGSTNYYVKSKSTTESGVDKNSTESALMNDGATTLDDYSTKNTEGPTDTDQSTTQETETAGSTNDYVQSTTESGVDKSSTEKASINDVSITLDDYSTKHTEEPSHTDQSTTPETVTAGSTNDYFQSTSESGVDKSSIESVSMNDAATTLDDYSTKNAEAPTDTGQSTTPERVTASSTNDYVKSTTESGVDKSSIETVSENDVATKLNDYSIKNTEGPTDTDQSTTPETIAAGSTNNYVQSTTESGGAESAPMSDAGTTANDYSTITTEGPSDTDQSTTPKTTFDVQSDIHTCSTSLCKQSTSRMLALMNHTAEPCNDFYSYACGGFDLNDFKEFTVNDNILKSLPG